MLYYIFFYKKMHYELYDNISYNSIFGRTVLYYSVLYFPLLCMKCVYIYNTYIQLETSTTASHVHLNAFEWLVATEITAVSGQCCGPKGSK